LFPGIGGGAEEGEAGVGDRARRDGLVENLGAARIKELHARADARIDIGKDGAEAANGGGRSAVAARDEEQDIEDVASLGREEALRAEDAERAAVGRVREGGVKAAERRLDEPGSRRRELRAAVILKTVERRSGCGGRGPAAVPVDLAASAGQRAGVVGVVGVAQSRAERIDRGLDRCRGRISADRNRIEPPERRLRR